MSEDASLQRPTFARRRRYRAVALVVGIPALVGLGATLAPPSVDIVHVVIEAPAPAIVTPEPTVTAHAVPPFYIEPPSAAQPPPVRPGCPAAVTTAPWVKPPKLPEQIISVVAARTNPNWLLAYNKDHAYLSTDGGRSFERVLDGVGHIRGVGIDCFGHPIIARAKTIGIRDGHREVWRSVPGIEIDHFERAFADEGITDTSNEAEYDNGSPDSPDVEILGGGPDIVVVGRAQGRNDDEPRARVAISSDLGETWTYRDLSPYWEGAGATGWQLADGTIEGGVMVTDCSYESMSWFRIDAGGKLREQDYDDPNGFLLYGDVMLGHGLTWARRSRIAADHAQDWKPLVVPGSDENAKAAIVADLEYARAIPAPYPLLVGKERVYRVVNGTVRQLPWIVSPEASSFFMDAAGRLWTVTCGQLHVAGRTQSPPLPCDSY